jgi:hypothetical protein
LPLIVRRHDEPTRAEAPLDLFQEMRVEHQLATGHVGNNFTGEVVLRGTKAATGNNDVSSLQGLGEDLFHALRVVADHRFVKQIHPKGSQPLGHPGRIRIHDLPQ